MQVTDSTLGDVVSQLTSAISLATSAANGTLSAAELSALAEQVTDIRNNMWRCANANYQGQYLFSGSQGTDEAVQLDTSTSPATTTYNGGWGDLYDRDAAGAEAGR